MSAARLARPWIALLSLAVIAAWGSAAAQTPAPTPDQIRMAALDGLRAQVADEVQLAAANLIDELIYGWTQTPPFDAATPVVLTGLSVPVGLGTGLAGLLENHLAGVLLANPSSHVVLSLCPACTSVVVHSGPQGTIVSRGADNPEALAKLGGANGRHALYIDLAAEGAWLVLRARITRLTPDLPIVWSRTLSAAVGAPSLLREAQGLKSPEAARREYLDALNGRGPFTVPVRLSVRAYAAGTNGIAPAPIWWIQTGFETALTQARKWKATAVLGYSWLPDAYTGFMAETRLARLISGPTRSLTGPDVYLFFGGALMTLDGPAMAGLANVAGTTRATYGGLHLGLELRVGNRIGTSVFLETMPTYVDQDAVLGSFFENNLIELHTLGAEVSLCF